MSPVNDTEATKLRKTNLEHYKELIAKYRVELIADVDEAKGILERPGSLPYLATVSHGLSHTKFWTEVETALGSAFRSGANPGYKKTISNKKN